MYPTFHTRQQLGQFFECYELILGLANVAQNKNKQPCLLPCCFYNVFQNQGANVAKGYSVFGQN